VFNIFRSVLALSILTYSQFTAMPLPVGQQEDIHIYGRQARGRVIINSWGVDGETFSLDDRFQVTEHLGKGSYGVVVAAVDDLAKGPEDRHIAIKKCKSIFQSTTIAKRTLREIRFLRLLNHPNVLKAKGVLQPFDKANFADLYVVLEIMETDLFEIIRSTQPLTIRHIQRFSYQLLQALSYLHSVGVVHRDLK
jgi:mitogen-activated protein kinase 1/3/mitogen-activated protein kinase 6